MALRKQSLTLQFAGGIDSKTDAKQVPQAKLLALENATFTKNGTLSKRNGYEALGGLVDGESSSYANVRGLGARGDDLVLMTDGGSYSYRPTTDTWSDIGDVASVQATCMPLARTGTAQFTPDAATVLGVTLVAWVDSQAGVWVSTIEAGTGRVLAAPTLVDQTGFNPRVVATQTTLVAMWPSSSITNTIYAVAINPAIPETIPTKHVLTDDLDPATQLFDAESAFVPALTDSALVAWVSTPTTYRIGYLTEAGELGTPSSGFASVATLTTDISITKGFSLTVGATYTAVLYAGSTMSADFLSGFAVSLRHAAVGALNTTNLLHLTGAFGPSMNTPNTSGQSFWWAAEIGGNNNTALNTVVSGALIPGSSVLDASLANVLQGHCLASKGFTDGPQPDTSTSPFAVYRSHAYVAVVKAVQSFPYVAVVRLSAGNGPGPSTTTGSAVVVPGFGGELTCCVARLLELETTGALFKTGPHNGGGPGGSGGPVITPGYVSFARILPTVTTLDREATLYGRRHSIPLGYRIQLANANAEQWGEVGIKLCALDFDGTNAFRTVPYGRGLYLAGANASTYDGSTWAEATIYTAADTGYDDNASPIGLDSVIFTDVGVGNMAAGTYLYKLWFEHTDAQGELHRGPVSSVEYTSDAAHKVQLAVPTYTLTRRKNVRLGVARSKVNQTGTFDTIPCYRITSTDPLSTGDNGFLTNDANDVAVIFVDNFADATLDLCEPLYTNGGILSNDPPHWRGDVIAGGKGRLYWTDPTDPNLVRYSQPKADETGLEASATLSLPVDPFGGAIVGIGVMDDAVLVFKETAVYAFGGPGPDADGGFLSQNAFTPASLVTSDVGCSSSASIAQTPDGVVFQSSKGIYMVGRDRNVTFIGSDVYGYKDQTITCATLLPDRHQVVFLTNAGATLLWDYERNQWSTYTNHEGLGAVVTGGVYHYLRADGRVFAETAGVYIDDNQHITMAIETAWIKMAGYLQGWQRCLYAYFIGAYKSSHTLRVRWRIDYAAGYSVPIDITVDDTYAPVNYGDGTYGDGAFGGSAQPTTLYQERVHVNRRCQAISFRVEDVQATNVNGASFELSELMLTGAVTAGAASIGANRSS